MIDGQNVFDQPVKHHLRTYEYIRKITMGQGEYYTTGCLLDYPYFKENYKLIVVLLSKQQALDADPKAIQQINFARNLARDPTANTTVFSLLKKRKKPF